MTLPVGTRTGGPLHRRDGGIQGAPWAVGHRLQKRLGRVTDPPMPMPMPMAMEGQHRSRSPRCRGARSGVSRALLKKAVSVCARPLALALLDQIPLAMEIYVFKCLVSAYVDRSAQRFFWGEGRRTRSSGLTSHGLLALVPHPHLSLSDQGFIAHTNWPHQNIMCQV